MCRKVTWDIASNGDKHAIVDGEQEMLEMEMEMEKWKWRDGVSKKRATSLKFAHSIVGGVQRSLTGPGGLLWLS